MEYSMGVKTKGALGPRLILTLPNSVAQYILYSQLAPPPSGQILAGKNHAGVW